jgi:hypothetical protein
VFEQTTWHILTVPASCTFHSLALRSISQARHAKGLTWLADLLGGEGSRWQIAEIDAGNPREGHNNNYEPEANRIKQQINNMRIQWSCAERAKPADQRSPLHFKPDLVLVRKEADRLVVRLVDMAFRTDTHLREEDEWSTKPPGKGEAKELKFAWDEAPFDKKGTASGPKPDSWPETTYKTAQKVPRFVQAQYAGRYKRMRTDMQNRLQARKQDIQVVAIAVGVMGFVPSFTHAHLDDLLGQRDRSKRFLPTARHIAWDHATLAWKAFCKEP